MYRALPVAGFSLSGLAGILCFAFGGSLPLLLAGAVSFGLYAGFFYFFLVYHALAHPTKAGRYVAINESVVGIVGVLAPLAGGFAVDAIGSTSPYLAAALFIVAVIVFQTWALRRRTD
jgi:MFS family permease